MSSEAELLTTMSEADEPDPTSIRPITQRGGSEADWFPPPTVDDLTLTAMMNDATVIDAPIVEDEASPIPTERGMPYVEGPGDLPGDLPPNTLPSGSLLVMQAMQKAQQRHAQDQLGETMNATPVNDAPPPPPPYQATPRAMPLDATVNATPVNAPAARTPSTRPSAPPLEEASFTPPNTRPSTRPMPPLPSRPPSQNPGLNRRVFLSPAEAPPLPGAGAVLSDTPQMMLRPAPRPNQTMVLRGLLNKPARAAGGAGALRSPVPTPSGPFDVDVIENVATPIRYRDAVRLGEDHVLLVMTDFAQGSMLSPALLARWKRVVRQAGARGDSPNTVLQILNQELSEVGLHATAACARLDLRERLIHVACAGAPAPFVLRSDERVVRGRVSPSVALGRVITAQFVENTLHFDYGDTLLVPSELYESSLESLFAEPQLQPIGKSVRIADWLRQRAVQPPGGSLLCLTLRH